MTLENPTRRPATLLDLDNLPEDVVGEIIDGQLHVHPRPDVPHVRAAYELGLTLGLPFYRGIDGPGGWVLLPEPRVSFGGQTLVPDLAGWRQERFVEPEKGPILVAPDWICEILSPSTARHDRICKLPIYGREGVQHAWLIDPVQRTLEVLRVESGAWQIVGLHQKNDKVRAEPFEALEIDMAQIWGASADEDDEVINEG